MWVLVLKACREAVQSQIYSLEQEMHWQDVDWEMGRQEQPHAPQLEQEIAELQQQVQHILQLVPPQHQHQHQP